MRFKNPIRYILTAASMTVLSSFAALAATASITFSDPSVTLGNEVNVTMKITSPDGTLSRSDVTLQYDAAHLEFESGTDADGGSGTIRVHGATNGEGTAVLQYNLKFKTLSAGTATITIGSQEVYDTDEALAEVTHSGSSTITIATQAAAASSTLQSLTVSPGTLTPAFSQDVTDYSVTVGTDVSELLLNAIATDATANVQVSGNENFEIGENDVTITVTGADGASQTVYNLKVTKQEGGPSAADGTETVNEGVKLSSKEKTITIMNPGADVAIPDGFQESSIFIDGHEVKGWVWANDTEHQYCIVYGMNDAGELNFYRYDLEEKTLQRYFQDPVADQMKKDAEDYPALVTKYDDLATQYNHMLILSCVLGAGVLVLFILVIVLVNLRRKSTKSDTVRKMNDQSRRDHENQYEGVGTPEDDKLGETIALDQINQSAPVEDTLSATRILKKDEMLEIEDLDQGKPKTEPSMGKDTLQVEDLDVDEPTMTISTDQSMNHSDIKALDQELHASAMDAVTHGQNAESMIQDTMIVPGVKEVKPEQSIDGLDIEDL